MPPTVEMPPTGSLSARRDIDSAESTAQENELFRAAFERSAVGMAHLSAAGIFLRVNARLCEMTGYSAAELTGMHFRRITLASDYGPAEEQRRMRLAREGGSYSAERRYVRKNGEIFWVHLATTMLPDADGAAKYGLSVIEDITPRKNAELRLQRLNRLHGVLSHISEVAAQAQDRQALFALAGSVAVQRGGLRLALVVEVDSAGGTLGSARALHDLDAALAAHGALADAARLGRRAVCTAGDAPGLARQDVTAHDRIGAAASFPLLMGGEPVAALVVGATETDYFQQDELDLLAAVATCMGLALDSLQAERQRKQAQEQVERQDFLLASAERIAGVGSWDLDVASGRIDGSDETMRIFGLQRETFAGTAEALFELVHPDDREALETRLFNMAASNSVIEIEYRIVRPDGEERVLLDRGAAVVIDGERSTRRAGMVIDITERRRADVRQQRHAQRMAALVQAQRELAHSGASLDELFDRVPAMALEVVAGDSASFELIDGNSMLCRALAQQPADALGMRFPMAGSLSGEAIQLGRTQRCDDSESDPRAALAFCRQYGLRSVLATVVRDSAGPIGVLKLFGKAPAMFGAADADSLELLAEALGAAIQRKRADEDVKRALHVQAGIARIQHDMVSSQGDLQALLDLMASRAHELTGAMGAAILMLDGDELVHRAAAGNTIGHLGLRFPSAGSLVGLCVASDELLRCDDAEADQRVNRSVFRQFGARSMMAAPLRVGSRAVGALAVASERSHAFAAREEGTLRILAEWLGALMQRAAAAQALRASEAQYRLVFAANPLPMWVFDIETLRFLAVNDAAIAKYGYTHAEFMAMTIRGIRPPEDHPLVDNYVAQGDAGGRIAGVMRHRTKDGSVIEVEVSSDTISFGERPARLVLAHDISERLRARRELQKNEAVLAIASRVAQVAGWSLDFGGQGFQYSDQLCALHEVPPGTVVSPKEIFEFYAPESQAAMRSAVRACATEGVPYDLELEIISGKGRRISVRTIGQAVRDAAGVIVGTQGAVQDISARKHAAEQLRALAARLTQTLESITDAFYTLDREWRFTYVNGQAERLLRRTSAEMIGRVIWEIFPQPVGSEFEQQSRRAVAENSAVNFETLLPAQQIWLDVHAYPSEAGLTIYSRDVTERHNAQRQLKLLETCVGHMNDVVIISELEPGGDVPRIVFVNDAFVRFTGYSSAEAVGQSPRLLHGAKTEEAEIERIRRTLLAGQPARAELIYYKKDGSTFWVDLEVVPVRSSAGIVTHWVGVQRDTTERRLAQDALRSLNDQLEFRVAERTAALDLARIDAEQASRAKSAFVATMSHEIRTPMNGVIGMIDVLEQTELAPEQSKMLGLASESAYSLMGIIDNILDFSKIEAGKVELEREAISVPDIVQKVCAMVAGVAASNGVRVVLHPDAAAPPAVLGDAVRVRQILVNLISNAIKFSRHSGGGGLVGVSTTQRARGPARTTVEFVVQDNGIGMDEATVGHLFTPFSQADASTTRRFGGTGLGLTITKHLVELMGGDIVVRSTPDVGSTFTVRLPFDVAAADSVARIEAKPIPQVPPTRWTGTGLRAGLILVAEDNPINQKVIAAQLKLLGFAAEIAGNGAEALTLWRSGRFAAVLTDLQMPEMDGYDLATSIRREEAGRACTPIIALTANALKDEAERCASVGMDGYLTKPVQLTTLEALLTLHLASEVPAPE